MINQQTAKLLRRFVRLTNKRLDREGRQMDYEKVKRLFLSRSKEMQVKDKKWMEHEIFRLINPAEKSEIT